VILRGARKGQEFIPVGRVALLASLLNNQLRASLQFDGRMQRRAFDG